MPLKVCQIAQMLPQGLVTMLQQLPSNPMVRTQVHAVLKWPIPQDKITYEQIKDWIEGGEYSNLKGAVQPRSNPVMPDELVITDDLPFTTAVRQAIADDHGVLFAEVRYEYTEVGTCRYTEQYRGTGEYYLTDDEMSEIADDAEEQGWNRDQIMEAIRDALRDKCYENTPETEPVENSLSHDDHESTDTNGSSASVVDTPGLQTVAFDWLRNNRPELWEDTSIE